MNRFSTGIVGAALALCIFPVNAFATPTIDEAAAELDTLGSELVSLQEELSSTTSDLEDTEYKIRECESDIKDTKQELKAAKEVLKGRMRSSYKTGGTSFISVLLDATGIDDFISRVYYMDKVSESDAEAISAVRDLEASLNDKSEKLSKRQSEQESRIRDLNAQIAEYDSRVADARAYYNSLSADVREAVSVQVASDSNVATAVNVIDSYVSAPATRTAVVNDTPAPAVNTDVVDTPASEPESDYEETYEEPTYEEEYVEPEPSYSGGYSGGGLGSAYAAIGAPYVWGAEGPDSFDCSGLVCWCYGYGRGRTTYDMIDSLQADGGWKTSVDQLVPGDIVFPSEGHVGIYVGDGMMIHAPTPGRTVCEAPVYAFIGGGTF